MNSKLRNGQYGPHNPVRPIGPFLPFLFKAYCATQYCSHDLLLSPSPYQIGSGYKGQGLKEGRKEGRKARCNLHVQDKLNLWGHSRHSHLIPKWQSETLKQIRAHNCARLLSPRHIVKSTVPIAVIAQVGRMLRILPYLKKSAMFRDP